MTMNTQAVLNALIPGTEANAKLNGAAHAIGDTTLNMLGTGTGTVDPKFVLFVA